MGPKCEKSGTSEANRSAMKKLGIACDLVGLFIVCEIIGGYLSGSLAIMGDAAHMFSDLASFVPLDKVPKDLFIMINGYLQVLHVNI